MWISLGYEPVVLFLTDGAVFSFLSLLSRGYLVSYAFRFLYEELWNSYQRMGLLTDSLVRHTVIIIIIIIIIAVVVTLVKKNT